MTPRDVADALVARGWIINHVSHAGASFYLTRKGDLSGKTEIRVSDHALGRKNGEQQGMQWGVNVVIDPTLSLDDHLRACEDHDYHDSGVGFGSGYSYAEYCAEKE